MKKNNPPTLASKYFNWICHESLLEELEGDLYELFDREVNEKGLFKARINFIFNVLSLTRPSVIKKFTKIQDNMDTLHHYVKSTIRSSFRKPGFTLISLSGLALSFAVCLLVLIYVSNELSYDQFRSNKNELFRTYNIRYGDDGPANYLPIVPPAYAPALSENFPEIQSVSRVLKEYNPRVFAIGDNLIEIEGGIYAEPNFVSMLEIQLKEGSVKSFNAPKSILLSESLYKKLYGDTLFRDQTLKSGPFELNVIGVYSDIPNKSHLKPPYILSFETAVSSVSEERMNSWQWQQFYTYIQLKPGQSIVTLQRKFQEFIAEKAHPLTKEYGFHYVPYFQNVTDIHLSSSDFEWEIAERGNKQSIIFIAAASLIILLIALFNFVNLFALQTIKKLKEISIRKVIGANQSQIANQLIVHSFIYVSIAFIAAVLFTYLTYPILGNFIGQKLTIDPLLQNHYILSIIGSLILIILICTFYPIIISMKFKPYETIYGIPKLSRSKLDLRFVLVGIQYVFSIGLIFCVLIVSKQYDYLNSRDMGFNPSQLIAINIPNGMDKTVKTLKSELLKNPVIKQVSSGYGTPGGTIAGDDVIIPEQENKNIPCDMIIGDVDYIETLGIEIIAGRNFREGSKDERSAFILNETAVTNFGFDSPEDALGKKINWTIWGSTDSLKKGEVIGIVKDFNTASLKNPISPLVIHINPQIYSTMWVRLNSEDLSNGLATFENVWKEITNDKLPQYEFVDELFYREYKSEQQLMMVFMVLTFIAVIIATIGIFSLVTHNINNFRKEISIRKVLGAGSFNIVKMITSGYIALATLALGVSLPVITMIMKDWLANYAFRIDIEMVMYAGIGMGILVFTFTLVGSHAFVAARSNIIDNLRNE